MTTDKNPLSMTDQELANELTQLSNGSITDSVKQDVASELAQLRSRTHRPQQQVFYAKVGLTPFRGGSDPLIEVVELPDGRYLAVNDNPEQIWFEITDNPQRFIDEVIDGAYSRIQGDSLAEERFDVQIKRNAIGYTVDDFYPVSN